MIKILKKFNVIIFFEFSKLLIKNSKYFEKDFLSFSKKNQLNLYDLNFKKKSIQELLFLLNATSKNDETIGDFIISNWNFKKK